MLIHNIVVTTLFYCDTADTVAFLNANTHGLEEEAEVITTSLGQSVDEVILIM